MDEPQSLKLSDAVRINPPISLDRGTNYPFVEMAALEPGKKYVGRSQIRPFSGGGARFEDGDTLMARITPCLENGKLAVYTADGNCRQAHGSTEFIVFRERAGVTCPVDFGPTRAKAEGRPPYLAPEIWDLFPDALDDKRTSQRDGTYAD